MSGSTATSRQYNMMMRAPAGGMAAQHQPCLAFTSPHSRSVGKGSARPACHKLKQHDQQTSQLAASPEPITRPCQPCTACTAQQTKLCSSGTHTSDPASHTCPAQPIKQVHQQAPTGWTCDSARAAKDAEVTSAPAPAPSARCAASGCISEEPRACALGFFAMNLSRKDVRPWSRSGSPSYSTCVRHVRRGGRGCQT